MRFFKTLFLFFIATAFNFTIEASPFRPLDEKWLDKLKLIIDQNDAESLLQKTELQLQEAKDIERSDLESLFLKELSWIHLRKTNDLEKAMGYAVSALEIDEHKQHKTHLLFTYLLLSEIFIEVDDYYNAGEFTEKALSLNREIDFESIQIELKQQLGNIYMNLASYEKAQAQYENVLAYAKASRYPKLEAENWYRIGHLEQLQNHFQLAINAYLNALNIHRRIKNLDQEALTLLAIGNSYKLMNEYDKSLSNFKVALDICRSLNKPEGLAKTYNALGSLFIKNKEFSRAIANLNYALSNGQITQDQNLIIETYGLLSDAHKGVGEFQSALKYQELKNALEDFIENEKNDRAILKMQTRYTIGQQQNTIDQLEFSRIQKENELEEKNRFNKFLIVLAILAIIIVLLILILLLTQRSSNKKLKVANEAIRDQNDQLENMNATKDKFFSIISHDLKGPLNSLTSFSSLLMNHVESLSKEEIQMLAADLDKSLKNLFALLENLLQWSRSQTGTIQFSKEKFDLAALLKKNKDLLHNQASNKNIEIIVKETNPIFVKAHEQSIDTVIRNLLSNAIKFTNESGKVKMGLTEDSNNYYVKVADNGVGMPPAIAEKIFRIDTKHSTQGTAKEKGTGLGLILCKEFVEKNGGTIKVKSEEDKGTLFTFSLPKAH